MAQNDSAHESGEADELLKKRARRRLVGAVALVLFAAIVLPMVMDHQPRPTNPEIQVRIPSQDAPSFEGRLPPARAAKPTVNQEQKLAAAVAPPAAPVTPQATADKPVADKSVADKLMAVATPESKPADVKPAESKPESKPKVEPKPVVKAEAKPTASAEGEQWVVQLGAYQELGRVKLLTGKLKELGLPVFTEKVDTPQGMRTRVRAGPFPDKDAAIRAQERAKIIGVTGPVAPK